MRDDRSGEWHGPYEDRRGEAPADGHILLRGSSGPIAILPSVNRRRPYDQLCDLLPIARAADFPLVVLASPASGLPYAAAFLARVRQAGEPLDYAGGAIGSTQHLAGALLAQRASFRRLIAAELEK